MRVICDTNVWYAIAEGEFFPPIGIELVSTEFSLYELVSTEVAVHDPILLQKAIRAVHKYSSALIPVDPFYYLLTNSSERFFEWGSELTTNMVKTFNEMLNMDFSKTEKIPDDIAFKVIQESQERRDVRVKYAHYLNSILPEKRKMINRDIGKNEYLKTDQIEEVKNLVFQWTTNYLKTKNDSIEIEEINWKSIEFFLNVTENFHKKLDTTKGMKFTPNDATDWLNLLYVEPGMKYLTFDKKWRKTILEDPITKDYLFV